MHKTLTQDVVQKVAENLMMHNDSTTTLDVKNQLRQEGFHAEQKTVSQVMMRLASRENWQVNYGNQFRSYRFRTDTQELLKKYLEKGDQYREIHVEEKMMTTGFGTVGGDGKLQTRYLKNNRLAMYQAQQFLEQYAKEGFIETKDSRPPLEMRKQYALFFKMTPKMGRIGYFGVQVEEKILATLQVGDQVVEGYILQEKNAGYEFSWMLPEKGTNLKKILPEATWDALNLPVQNQHLTGEKVLKQTCFTQAGKAIENAKILKLGEVEEVTKMKVDNTKLYHIQFTFTNDRKLALSKFKLDREKELVPLAMRFLQT